MGRAGRGARLRTLGAALSHAPFERLFGPWVRALDARTLRGDALAAVLVAVLALPQGIAFAALAGLPPAWGLNTAIVCGLVAAFAGSSRVVVTGPTNALALALAAALAPLAAAGSPEYLRLALAATLMLGLMQLAVAFTRLGALAHFVSPSVLLGFMAGAALLIAAQGGKGVLGWPTAQPLLGPAWPAVQSGALVVAAVTLATLLLLRRLWPRGPTFLLALVAGTAASLLLPAPLAAGLARVGTLPAAWPVFAWPELQWADLRRLLDIALALTIVSLGQTVAVAKSMAARLGHAFDVNRECFGQGLANAAGSCFGAFAACGSLNRTLPAVEAGARTPLAAAGSSLVLLAIVVAVADAIARIPLAAIAALLLVVAFTLVDRAQWRALLRQDRREAAIALATALAMLLLPLEQAILLGVAASLVVYLHRTAHPALRTMGFAAPPGPGVLRPFVVLEPGAPECPQLKLLRMEGSVWFGAAAHVADALAALRRAPQPARHLLVMSKSMNFVDVAGVALWEQERRDRVALGGALYFHRPRPEVLAAWRRDGFVDRLGADHLFADKRSAIAAIVPRLDGDICARCSARVFEECARQPGATPTSAPAPAPPG